MDIRSFFGKPKTSLSSDPGTQRPLPSSNATSKSKIKEVASILNNNNIASEAKENKVIQNFL